MASKAKSKIKEQPPIPVVNDTAPEPAAKTLEPPTKATSKIERTGMRDIALTLPLADVLPSESQRDSRLRIDTSFDRKHREAFMQLRSGLRQSNARLSDGRPVWSSPDVIRWMCESIIDAAGSV